MPHIPRSVPDNTLMKADLTPCLSADAAQAAGVCAHLMHYKQIVSIPPKKCEVRMLQALIGLESFTRRQDGVMEAAALVRDMRYLRHTCRRSSKHNVSTELVLSVFGFSNVRERDIILRVMRYGLQPRLIWTAEVGRENSGKWEALIVLDLWRWPVSWIFGKHENLVELLEKLFESCRQSIGVLELPKWTDPATITALQRLQAGRHKRGNLLCHMNRSYLLEHEVEVLKQKQEVERARLREHTDLYFSADNMLYLLRELRAAHYVLEQTRRAVVHANHGIHTLETELHLEADHLTNLHNAVVRLPEASGLQEQMQSVRHSAVQQLSIIREIESDLNRLLAETALRAPNVIQSAPAEPPSPPAAFSDPLTSPPLGPGLATDSRPEHRSGVAGATALQTAGAGPNEAAPQTYGRFHRVRPAVTLRVLARPPALAVGMFRPFHDDNSQDPIEVD